MLAAARRPFLSTLRGRASAWSAVFVLASGVTVPAAAATIDVRRDGETFFVQASADIAADPRTAWNTITDYQRLREFLPDVERSRVLARDGNRLTVEHRGQFRLYFYTRPVRVRLAVEHEPFARVIARSDPGTVDGEAPTLRSFVGRYVLTVVEVGGRAGVRLHYDAQFELTEGLPPLIGPLFGAAIVRATMREQFEAMVREIERRQAARPAIEKSG